MIFLSKILKDPPLLAPVLTSNLISAPPEKKLIGCARNKTKTLEKRNTVRENSRKTPGSRMLRSLQVFLTIPRSETSNSAQKLSSLSPNICRVSHTRVMVSLITIENETLILKSVPSRDKPKAPICIPARVLANPPAAPQTNENASSIRKCIKTGGVLILTPTWFSHFRCKDRRSA